MMLSYVLISFMVTALVVGVKPWWKPQYFIPLGGMVPSINSMMAVGVVFIPGMMTGQILAGVLEQTLIRRS